MMNTENILALLNRDDRKHFEKFLGQCETKIAYVPVGTLEEARELCRENAKMDQNMADLFGILTILIERRKADRQ